jgi:hypothetical protein
MIYAITCRSYVTEYTPTMCVLFMAVNILCINVFYFQRNYFPLITTMIYIHAFTWKYVNLTNNKS